MKNALDNLLQEALNKLRKAPQPEWISPMLATLTDKRFSDKDWIFERKLDGERCLAFRHDNNMRLMSRNQKELNNTYPELVDSLLKLKSNDFIVDGEIVAFEGDKTSFSRLQGRMQIRNRQAAMRSNIKVFYYLFDLLYLGGYDVAGLELRHRKMLLMNLFSEEPERLVRYTEHREEEGLAYFKDACAEGWEGLIAKRASSPYSSKRSRDWLKFKCSYGQELVIGGYTEPRSSRIGFGALLVGYYEGNHLVYAGKVGTGFNENMLQNLGERLSSIERRTSPFADYTLPAKGVHWVEPELVGQIGFSEWTPDGRLRHPRFLGLRDDKDPHEVVKER